MRRKHMFLIKCLISVLLFSLSSVAYAADEVQIFPLAAEDTHALLLKYGESNLIIGGSDTNKVIDHLNTLHVNSIAGVAAPCSHDAHIAALEEITTFYQTHTVSPQFSNQIHNATITWLDQGFRLDTPNASYAFGVNEAVDNCISYRCDGTLIAFSATTNESAVNVRAKASTKADRVAKLQRGHLLTVTSSVRNDQNEVWYAVALSDGTTGYIRHDLLQPASIEAKVSVEEPSPKENTKETRYIGNKNSKVFHRPSCKTLPKAKNQVYFDSKDYALAKGYRPCKNCDP